MIHHFFRLKHISSILVVFLQKENCIKKQLLQILQQLLWMERRI